MFAHVANRGTTSAKAGGKTLSRSPTADLAVGALVLVWVAWDNNNTGTPDTGPVSEQMQCRDSVGNVWTTLVSGQNRGAAQQATGAQGAIHICRLEHAITTADTITVRLGVNNNLVAKAMSIEEFSIGESSLRWCLYEHGSRLDNGTDPGSLSVAANGSVESLIVHVLCGEGPDSDAYTWDSDYTQIAGAGTTGGVADSNMHVRGGYRIATLSSDTIDVQSDTADRDYWQGWASIYAYTPFPEFPTTPILDDFNRADESPLSKSGAWITSSFLYGPTVALAVSSNQAKAGSPSTLYRGQWWGESFSREQEAFVTCTAIATGEDDGFGVGIDANAGDTNSGFRVLWHRFPASDAASEDGIILGRADPNSISRVMYSWNPMVVGCKLGMKLWENEVAMYVDNGAGWQWVSAFNAATDLTGTKLSLICRDQIVRVDDFGGGGTIPPLPQTGRRLRHVRIPDV